MSSPEPLIVKPGVVAEPAVVATVPALTGAAVPPVAKSPAEPLIPPSTPERSLRDAEPGPPATSAKAAAKPSSVPIVPAPVTEQPPLFRGQPAAPEKAGAAAAAAGPGGPETKKPTAAAAGAPEVPEETKKPLAAAAILEGPEVKKPTTTKVKEQVTHFKDQAAEKAAQLKDQTAEKAAQLKDQTASTSSPLMEKIKKGFSSPFGKIQSALHPKQKQKPAATVPQKKKVKASGEQDTTSSSSSEEEHATPATAGLPKEGEKAGVVVVEPKEGEKAAAAAKPKEGETARVVVETKTTKTTFLSK